MTKPSGSDREEVADRVVASVARAEETAIKAVRDFVETVNRTFADEGKDSSHRQQIIDSAFKMTEQLVGASNELAHRVVKVGHGAANRVPGHKSAARKAAARQKTTAATAKTKKSAPTKAAAKRTAVRKVAAALVVAKRVCEHGTEIPRLGDSGGTGVIRELPVRDLCDVRFHPDRPRVPLSLVTFGIPPLIGGSQINGRG